MLNLLSLCPPALSGIPHFEKIKCGEPAKSNVVQRKYSLQSQAPPLNSTHLEFEGGWVGAEIKKEN